MSDIAIKIDNISKLYQLGTVSTQTMYGDLHRWWARVRGKEDPYQKVGTSNTLNSKDGEFVWALRDINLEIKQGDVVGIIGKNGAGKSTLLKILSRVTAPTTGQITVNGRIASLLEVGTGFHPELTGRENIFLNGAIMGMSKAEIRSKFDEIVDFSGVEKYIDTPVKRYSSGMYVRLAFAVAAHLDPEILIVDEVLAVGDAEFQKKALGKMQAVSQGQGRTVLFVSHNMAAIQNLCSKSILFCNGQVDLYAATNDTIKKYLSNENLNHTLIREIETTEPYISKLSLINYNDPKKTKLLLDIEVSSIIETEISVDFRIINDDLSPVGFCSLGTFNENELISIKKGKNKLKIEIDIHQLAIGDYILGIDLTKPDIKYFDKISEAISFKVLKPAEIGERRVLDRNWNYGAINFKLNKVNYEH